METSPETVGFIGIGRMGASIVRRLLAAGYEVIVWNRTPERCDEVIDAGAEAAESIVELVERASIIMLCLSDTAAVDEIVFGDDGIADNASDAQLLIDLSGTWPAATRRFAESLQRETGMAWVDAALAGGPAAAERGALLVFAGGHEADVERARPLCESFAKRVTRMGGIGSGQLARICHQMLACSSSLVLAEMIAFAERAGIDAERLPEAFAGGFADSLPLQIFGPRIAVREFEPVLGTLETLCRDLDTAAAVAAEHGAAIPLTALAGQLARQHAVRAAPGQDWSTLIELYSE